MSSSIITFDLAKVVTVEFYWRNQIDSIRHAKQPLYHSCNGVMFNALELAPYIAGYELEITLERAIRLDTLDHWTPVVVLRLVNGYPLTYEGKKALSIKSLWNARIYGKKKKT